MVTINTASLISTTQSVSSSTSKADLILSSNISFNFDQLSSSQSLELLSSSYDLSGCVVNCSNNGMCKFVSNTFFCLCDYSYFTGYACQTDTRPCSSNPCLNNATCVDYSNAKSFNMSSTIGNNSSEFYCFCDEYHEGSNCEIEKNICQNETCSSNGNCVAVNNKAKCNCFSMYSGDRCETESAALKTVKAIISTTSIIAILTLIFFYCLIIVMDIIKYFFQRKKFRNKKIGYTIQKVPKYFN